MGPISLPSLFYFPIDLELRQESGLLSLKTPNRTTFKLSRKAAENEWQGPVRNQNKKSVSFGMISENRKPVFLLASSVDSAHLSLNFF